MIVAAFVSVLSVLLITLIRKKQPRLSTKYWDFISIAAVFFGGFAFISLLSSGVHWGQAPGDSATKLMLIMFPTVLIVFMISYLVLYFWKGVSKSKVSDDERTEANGTKSARNALLVDISVFESQQYGVC
jgi:glucan phosphoethanolaminetransferase (alkaline phosphatase superfamily)